LVGAVARIHRAADDDPDTLRTRLTPVIDNIEKLREAVQ
jgi:hypothetical protein